MIVELAAFVPASHAPRAQLLQCSTGPAPLQKSQGKKASWDLSTSVYTVWEKPFAPHLAHDVAFVCMGFQKFLGLHQAETYST